MIDDWPLPLEMPLGVNPNNDFAAFQNAFRLERPYGLSGTLETSMFISQALRLSTVAEDPAARVHAVIKSTVKFNQNPPFLELRPLPFGLAQLGTHLRYSPLMASVLYSNIDPASVRPAAEAVLRSRGLDEPNVQDQANRYMAGELRLFIHAGEVLGRGAVDANLGGRRRVDLEVRDKNGTSLNPAHFLFQWDRINPALANHPLTAMLKPLQHGLVFPTNGRILFVKKDNATPTPPYDVFDKAARKINDAIGQAQSGDIVLVVDNSLYSEKISLPTGVSLTSVGAVGRTNRIQEAPNNYPTISQPNAIESAIKIDGVGESPIHVSGFLITGGVAQASAIPNGGGIRIRNCHNVEIAYNDIFGNLAGRGGGIAVINSSRVSILGNVIHDNAAADLTSIQGQGGGVYVGFDSIGVRVDDNGIYKNNADNYGGGVAVVEANKVTISGNLIGGFLSSEGNKVNKDRLPFVQSVIQDNPQGGAGGIGVYQCAVDILDNKIHNNESNSGGGIEFYTIAGGNVIGNEIENNRTRQEQAFSEFPVGGDGGGIAVNPTSLTRATAESHLPVVLRDNRIVANHAEDDGGGVYATVKSIITIEGCTVSGNSSRHNGGGIRCSFGSRVAIKDCDVFGNRANLETNPNPGARKSGGGGIAIRDCKATIENTRITSNTVEGFAGGGLYFVTLEEGAPLPPPVPSFDDLLTGPLDFDRGELIVTNCEITNNHAKGPLGAGGGLYLPFDHYNVHLHINSTTLSPNTAEHSDPAKAKNIVIQDNSTIADDIVNDDNFPSLTPLANFETVLEP